MDDSCGDSEWTAVEEEKILTQQGLEFGAQLSAQIEQFRPTAIVDAKAFSSHEARGILKTGLEVTNASIHNMASKLRNHEGIIEERIWRMIPSKQLEEKTAEELEKLQATKDSLGQCIRLISDARPQSLSQDVTLVENSFCLTVSTISALATARSVHYAGRPKVIGGDVSDKSLQTLSDSSDMKGRHSTQETSKADSGTDGGFQLRYGRGVPLANVSLSSHS